MYKYPYGDCQQLNLDWILGKLKELEASGGAGGTDLEEVSNALISLTYNTDTLYARYDYAFRNGKLYRCLTGTTGSFDPAAWQEALIGDDLAVLTRWINAINASVDALENAVNYILPTSYGAVYDGTTDCASAIQSAINNANGKTVKFSGNGTALIGSTLIIKEDTHILLDKGFTLKMKANTNCPMFKNAPADIAYNDPSAGQNIQNNISIIGGTLDFNGNNQTWQNSNFKTSSGIVLADVNNLVLSDLHLIDPITFAIFINGTTNFIIKNIFADFTNQHANMDCIHLGGGNAYGSMQNIYGTSNDDFIAINSGDTTTRYGTLRVAPCHDINITQIKCNNGFRGVRLLAGAIRNSEIYNININGIEGNFINEAVLLSTYDTQTQAFYENITIENVCAKVKSAIIKVQGNYSASTSSRCYNLNLSNINYRQEANRIVNVLKNTPQSLIHNLNINNVNVSSNDVDISNTAIISNDGTIDYANINNVTGDKPTSYNGMSLINGTAITTLNKNNIWLNGNPIADEPIKLYYVTGPAGPAANGLTRVNLSDLGIPYNSNKIYIILKAMALNSGTNTYYALPIGAFNNDGSVPAFFMQATDNTVDFRIYSSGTSNYFSQPSKLVIAEYTP